MSGNDGNDLIEAVGKAAVFVGEKIGEAAEKVGEFLGLVDAKPPVPETQAGSDYTQTQGISVAADDSAEGKEPEPSPFASGSNVAESPDYSHPVDWSDLKTVPSPMDAEEKNPPANENLETAFSRSLTQYPAADEPPAGEFESNMIAALTMADTIAQAKTAVSSTPVADSNIESDHVLLVTAAYGADSKVVQSLPATPVTTDEKIALENGTTVTAKELKVGDVIVTARDGGIAKEIVLGVCFGTDPSFLPADPKPGVMCVLTVRNTLVNTGVCPGYYLRVENEMSAERQVALENGSIIAAKDLKLGDIIFQSGVQRLEKVIGIYRVPDAPVAVIVR